MKLDEAIRIARQLDPYDRLGCTHEVDEMAQTLVAAIERVRAQATETLRLCREAGVPESSAHLSPLSVLRALDGPRASK